MMKMVQNKTKVKKAMIMAAGVGSRLEPLTLDLPKPLVPIANIPVMDLILQKLKLAGVEEVIANVHYLADKIIDHYNHVDILPISFLKEKTLSGTSGGVKKCQNFFNKGEDFVVLSADGVFDLDLQEVINAHQSSGSIATIVVKKVDKKEVYKYGVILKDENGYVKDFQEKPKVEDAISNLVNTGIYVFKYDIFNYIEEKSFSDFAKDIFPKLLKENQKINTFEFFSYWNDIGTLNQYAASTMDVLSGKFGFFSKNVYQNAKTKYTSASELPKTLKMRGFCVVGKNCHIGENVLLENSILWDNVSVASDVTIKNCTVANSCTISESIKNQVFRSGSVV